MQTKQFWATSNFKELQKKWDKKLSKSGFEDIEKTVGGDRVLISSSNPYRDSANTVMKESKEEYFRTMTQNAYHCKYDNTLDRLILTRYVSGATIKEICEEIKKKGSSKHRETVRLVIHKYEDRWGIRKWNKKKHHTKS